MFNESVALLATIENQARFSKIIYKSPETRKQSAIFSLEEFDFRKPDLGLWQLLRRLGYSLRVCDSADCRKIKKRPLYELGDV